MLSPTSLIFLVVLCVLIGGTLLKLWLSRDKSVIWSPLTFVDLTLIYYVVLPSFQGLNRHGAANALGQHLFYIAAVLFYVCVLIAFSWRSKPHFRRWNTVFNTDNAQRMGVLIFLFALACYVPFRGFRTTIWAEDAYMVSARTGLVSYFIDLISVFCGACALMYMYLKGNNAKWYKSWPFMLVLYFTIIFYVVGGFRVRLVYLIISLATVYHIYPRPRKINYPLVTIIAIVAYLGFAIMDVSRSYGTGIKRDAAAAVSLEEASAGAGESSDVCCFSIVAMDQCQRNNDYCYFEPIVTAILMPIPRAIFPDKPIGEYMIDIQVHTIGSADGGAAFLNFAEGFYAFSWFGVILYGLLMGWMCGVVWHNYQENRNSMGAIMLLALFNGFCYQWISRGYLGGNFNSLLYYVAVPFWLALLFRNIFPGLKKQRTKK